MTSEEVRVLAWCHREEVAAVAGSAVLVLPVGATEQHGPALPLGTDSALVDAVLGRALASYAGPAPVVVAPTVTYGNSQHHLFACAGSVRPATLLALYGDLVDSFVTSGFRRIFVLNGHGGNDECARLAVKEAALRHRPLLAAACSYWTLADREPDVPGHAGAFEASLLLAARPDLLADPPPAAEPAFTGAYATEPAPGVTLARAGDWATTGGFTDDPAGATAAGGERRLATIGSRLAAVLAGFAATPLEG
ncbi:MAG: creatininase family protein [Mycobacteriales bacterium]